MALFEFSGCFFLQVECGFWFYGRPFTVLLIMSKTLLFYVLVLLKARETS